MARRRRTCSSCYGFSASFSTVSLCFKERTSFVFPNFAQSRRRRFTGSKSGVSLRASDAEPSDTKSNEESMVLVAREPGSPQIWRARPPTSVFLLLFVDRDPFSVYNRRSFSYHSCFSGFNLLIPQQLPSSAASATWFIYRSSLHSHAADLNLGFQELLFFWAWPISFSPKGLDSSFSLVGSIDNWPTWSFYLVWPINPMVTHLSRCFTPEDSRCCNHLRFAPPSLLVSFPPKSVPVVNPIKEPPPIPSSLLPRPSVRYESDPNLRLSLTHLATPLTLSQLSSCQVQERSISLSSYLKEVIISRLRFSMRVDVFSLGYLFLFSPPRYQNSSCRGQREIAFTILLLEGENFSTIILVFMALVCCACVARSGLELEGDSSETLLSDIVKGSANVAVSMIVISVLVAVSIANNRSLCVLYVSQGIISLTSSKVVKVRRLHDIYGLSVKIACNYPFIFHVCVFRLPFEAAMALLSSDVTNSYGE